MNKKHFIGMLIVLLISGFVIWQELRKTPVKALWGASKKLNINFLLLVLLVMVLSYACEAAIIWILEHKKESLIAPHGLFSEFQLFKHFLMP